LFRRIVFIRIEEWYSSGCVISILSPRPTFRGVELGTLELGTLTMEVQSLIEEQVKASPKINKAKKKKTFHTSCLFNRKLLLLPTNRFRG